MDARGWWLSSLGAVQSALCAVAEEPESVRLQWNRDIGLPGLRRAVGVSRHQCSMPGVGGIWTAGRPADRRTASSGGIPAALIAVVFRPWPRATDAAPAVPTDQLLPWPRRAPTDLQPRWVWANGEPSGLSAASIPPLDPDGVDFGGLDLDRSRSSTAKRSATVTAPTSLPVIRTLRATPGPRFCIVTRYRSWPLSL